MQFGGWTHLGGAAQLGGSSGGLGSGSESRWDIYYRALRSMRPPGAYSDDDDSIHAAIDRVLAAGLGDHAHVLADAIWREVFPQFADELIADWEAMLRISAAPSATLDERRQGVLARWRGGVGNELASVRSVLAPLLNPVHAFWDLFDSPSVSWRWSQVPGGGSIAQAGSQLAMAISPGEHGDWIAGELCRRPLATIPLVDLDDDATLEVLVASMAASANVAAGVALYESDTDAWMLSVTHDGDGDLFVQLDRIEDGVLARQVAVVTAPAFPLWLRLERLGGSVRASYGASLTALTPLTTAELGTVRPRSMALWLRNTEGSLNIATVGFEEVRLSHGKPENNVEFIETPLSLVPTQNPENIFFAFVHRDSADGGTYDLRRAQQQIDRMKLAHLCILVGESDLFLYDDDHSLFDRDVLGV